MLRHVARRTRLTGAVWPGCRATHSVAQVHDVGDVLHGFKVTHVSPVPELDLIGYRLRHLASGADMLHVARADANNTFAIGFRTTPADDSGVAHILEHTSLCGSDKFPVRDPFFAMTRRSLATYMNAWTGSDWTVYPFSTQNSRDFQHLMAIYLDAVFHPLLRIQDFHQEGHRLEPSDLSDAASDLVIKGVVYNEMKGVMSDSSSRFALALEQNLFPDTPYRFNSGGDPISIPSLTYEQLRSFHHRFYCPANARVYSYGDQPLSHTLPQLDAVLSSRDPGLPADAIPVQPAGMRDVTVTCAPDPLASDPSRQCTAAVAYAMPDEVSNDPYNMAVMQMLTSLLIDNQTSPMHRALLSSNLGSDMAPGSGFSRQTRQAVLTLGASGVREQDIPQVYQAIDETLAQVAEQGFRTDDIDAYLHQIELSMKKPSPHFGLGLMTSLISPWFHGCDPLEPLHIDEQIKRLRRDLADGPLFQQSLQRWVPYEGNAAAAPAAAAAATSSRLRLQQVPSDEFLAQEEQAEAALLQRVRAGVTDADARAELAEAARELAQRQSEASDVSSLPMLSVAKDVAHAAPDSAPLRTDLPSGVPVFASAQATNGLHYVKLRVPTSHLTLRQKQLLPLFAACVRTLGAGDRDEDALSRAIERYTGGVSTGLWIATGVNDNAEYNEYLTFGSCSLADNRDAMYDLVHSIVAEPAMRPQHLRTRVAMIASGLADAVTSSGHRFAMADAAAALNDHSALNNLQHGLPQLALFRGDASAGATGLLDLATETPDTLADELRAIAASIACASADVAAAVVASPQHLDDAVAAADQRVLQPLSDAAARPRGSGDSALTRAHRNVYHVMPQLQVNYCAQVHETVPMMHELSPALLVLSKLLNKTLHTEIREKGGAYGGGCGVSGDGLFQFYSYRDPHASKTFDVFSAVLADAAASTLSTMTDQDLEEAKISVFQAADAPTTPMAKLMPQLINGLTPVQRQLRRDRLRAVSKDQVQQAAALLAATTPSRAVLGAGVEEVAQRPGEQWHGVHH